MRWTVLTVLIGMTSFSVQADIYRIIRADGVVEYSDVPDQNAKNVTRQLQENGKVLAKQNKRKIRGNSTNGISIQQQGKPMMPTGSTLSFEQQQDIRNWEHCWHLDEQHVLHWICATTAMVRSEK